MVSEWRGWERNRDTRQDGAHGPLLFDGLLAGLDLVLDNGTGTWLGLVLAGENSHMTRPPDPQRDEPHGEDDEDRRNESSFNKTSRQQMDSAAEAVCAHAAACHGTRALSARMTQA